MGGNRGSSAGSAAAIALLLCVLIHPGADATIAAPRSMNRSMKRLERPVHWVGEAHVLGNSTADAESTTEVLRGVVAVDGRFALVVQHEQLPRLAPIKTTFTVSHLTTSDGRPMMASLAPSSIVSFAARPTSLL